jgi:hypothetical protein
MTAVFTYDVTLAPLAPAFDEQLDAFEAYRHAQDAAAEVRASLSRAQCAGPEGLPPGAEFFLDEADLRREALELLLGLRAKRERVVVPPQAGDWRDRIGDVDWGKSRGAA